MRWHTRVMVLLILVWAGSSERLLAQGLTGQVAGSVVNSSGSVMPGVTVKVVNTGTQATRDVVTDSDGNFSLTGPPRRHLRHHLTLSGFKTFTQRGIVLSANERVALSPITLEVGEMAETISIVAEAARVQTQSAERSGLITQEQIKEIALKGRDYMGMLKLMPGVVDTRTAKRPAGTTWAA